MTTRHKIMENGKKFVIRRGDWRLTIYNDNAMMLILHRPAKITYDDATQSILIARPVTSYRFTIDDATVYQTFKDLGLETVYAE